MSLFSGILSARPGQHWFHQTCRLVLFVSLVACAAMPVFPSTPALSKLQDGDIIWQTSRSSQSRAIQMATHSNYSHMGMVFRDSGRLFVLEAVGPVKLTPIKEWISRGERSEFVVKRLRQPLASAEGIRRLRRAGFSYIGKPYDPYFGWSNDKLYCSELVWKVYKSAIGVDLGKLRTLSSFDLSSKVVQNKLRQRYGRSIPLSEPVISPADIFDCEHLQRVS